MKLQKRVFFLIPSTLKNKILFVHSTYPCNNTFPLLPQKSIAIVQKGFFLALVLNNKDFFALRLNKKDFTIDYNCYILNYIKIKATVLP